VEQAADSTQDLKKEGRKELITGEKETKT